MLRQAQRISLARRLSRPLSSESSAPSTPRAFAVPRPRFNPAATATRGDRPPFQRREGEQTPREQTPREPRFGTLVEGNEMEGLVLRASFRRNGMLTNTAARRQRPGVPAV